MIFDRIMTEEQFRKIILESLNTLLINEDHSISKDNLKYDIDKVSKIVDKLNINLNKVHVLEMYSRKVYIPVLDQLLNVSKYDVNISLTTNSKTAVLGLVIPAGYSKHMNMAPVVSFINVDTRSILNNISVKFISVARPSNSFAKEYYYEIDLNLDTIANLSEQIVDVTNFTGKTELVVDIYKGDVVADTRVDTIKTITVKAEPLVGFDDIPDRDKLVRSTTMKNYEVISQQDYEGLEADDSLDPETVYSIPEKYQINS
ncbi:MAG: hypothetical protein ACRCX8_12710 [Sarcina sp.]